MAALLWQMSDHGRVKALSLFCNFYHSFLKNGESSGGPRGSVSMHSSNMPAQTAHAAWPPMLPTLQNSHVVPLQTKLVRRLCSQASHLLCSKHGVASWRSIYRHVGSSALLHCAGAIAAVELLCRLGWQQCRGGDTAAKVCGYMCS